MVDTSFEVLVVEDNPADVEVTKAAWESDPGATLLIVSDGEAASRWTESCEKAPDLILLDLNLPRRSGHDVLRDIRASERLKNVPVVVISSSDRNEDIQASYDGGANCYVVKPSAFAEYLAAMEEVEQFWRHSVALPG